MSNCTNLSKLTTIQVYVDKKGINHEFTAPLRNLQRCPEPVEISRRLKRIANFFQ